jgi:hypothetical protein
MPLVALATPVIGVDVDVQLRSTQRREVVADDALVILSDSSGNERAAAVSGLGSRDTIFLSCGASNCTEPSPDSAQPGCATP